MPDVMSQENYALIQAFLDSTEEYYSDVVDIADKNLKSSEFAEFPSDMQRDYKKWIGKADAAYNGFTAAVDRIDPAAPDRRRVNAAKALQGKVETNCEILEAKNAVFSAFVDTEIASKCNAVIALLLLIVASSEGQLDRAKKRVVSAGKSLEKARKLVREAKIQRGLNMAVSVVTATLVPELKAGQAIWATITVAAGRITLDGLMGPKGPTLASSGKTVGTEYLGFTHLLSSASRSIASTVSAMDTLVSDGIEVGVAEKLVRSARKDLLDAQKTLDKLERVSQPNGIALTRLTADLQKARIAADSKVSAYRAAKLEAQNIEKELEYVQ